MAIAAVTLHMHCSEGLFRRAIAMSGTYFMTAPLPLDVHEEVYKQAIHALKLTDASLEERLKVLIECPVEELMMKIPPTLPIAFAVDGDLIPSPAQFAHEIRELKPTSQASSSCKDLLIGNAQMDVSGKISLYRSTAH